jgi:chaperonin GroEL
MEKFKKLLGANDAQKSIRDGIIIAAEMIAPTLGSRGRKIVLDAEFGTMDILDDGAGILDKIELEDTRLQMGVKMLKEAANKTNDKVGDGTTTTSILASELVKNIVSDKNPLLIENKVGNVLKIKKELNAGVKKIIDFIDSHKIEIDDKRLEAIGTISSNSPEIGKILAELFKKLGKDASIITSDSQNLETTHEIVEGMRIDKGFIAKAMVTDPEKNQAILENARVLVTDYKIQNPQDIKTLIELITGKVKGSTGPDREKINDLLIVADDIQGTPLDFLVANKLEGFVRVIGVKAPTVGDYRELLKDIAVISGAQFISKENGREFKDIGPEHLGKALRVVSTIDETNIVGGGGSKEEIQTRIKSIETQMGNTSMSFDKEYLKERISKLSGGIGIIKVGGAIESEVTEKKAKIDDAIHAVRAALKDGGIPGGGIMLLRASAILDNTITGESILKSAIQKPFEQLLINADYDVEEVRSKILSSDNLNFGFNIETEEYGDLVEAGVIDPALVAKTALQNAVSIALLVLTISGANTLVREKDKKE